MYEMFQPHAENLSIVESS